MQFPNSHNPRRKQTQGWKCQKKQQQEQQLDTECAWPDVEKDDGGHERERERESVGGRRGGGFRVLLPRGISPKSEIQNSKNKVIW